MWLDNLGIILVSKKVISSCQRTDISGTDSHKIKH